MVKKFLLLFLTTGLAAFFTTSVNAANVHIQVTGNGTSESHVSINNQLKTYRFGSNTLVVSSNVSEETSINWDERAKNTFLNLTNELNQEDAKVQTWLRSWLELHNFSRKTFWTFMRGSEEVPGPGDTDGYGITRVKVNTSNNEVCVVLRVFDIQSATAAHIHKGGVRASGPVVVTLPTPDTNGKSRGCVLVDDVLADALRDNPSNYYVNVHNTEFPNGAVRGQLR